MKKLIFNSIVFSLLLVLSSCEKEAISKKLGSIQGKWKITEFKYFEKYTIPATSTKPKIDTIYDMNDIFDIKSDVHSIEFFENNNPYTASQRGVYKIDYSNELIKDLVDTFYFNVNKKEISFDIKNTKSIKYNNIYRKPILPQIPFPMYRFEFDEPSSNQLFLNGTPFRLNEECYFKLEKINL